MKIIDRSQLIATTLFKTEMLEACSDNTVGAINDEEHGKMHVKEESEHCCIKEDIINHVTDISQHDSVMEVTQLIWEKCVPLVLLS